jgi:hypothetical protein
MSLRSRPHRANRDDPFELVDKYVTVYLTIIDARE